MHNAPLHEECAPTPWEQLPDLDLYMDQVLTLLNQQIERLSAGTDRPLTSSMINNYVKDGVMPRPTQKKYNREHLTVLCLICMLKAPFTLPEIQRLLTGLSESYDAKALYGAFCEAQSRSTQDMLTSLQQAQTLDESERYLLAMQLALEANTKRIAAARLLAELAPEESAPVKEKKKKDK